MEAQVLLSVARPAHSRICGLTLVELLVVLAVVAILATVAVPGFKTLLREMQATRMVEDYVRALRIGRSVAMAVHEYTVVCQSDRLQHCTAQPDWASGWLVFRDPDGDGECDGAGDGLCADGGQVLLAHRPNLNGFDFIPNGNPLRLGYVSYDPAGFAIGQNSRFSLCDRHRVAAPRAVVLSFMGRVRVAVVEDADCD